MDHSAGRGISPVQAFPRGWVAIDLLEENLHSNHGRRVFVGGCGRTQDGAGVPLPGLGFPKGRVAPGAVRPLEVEGEAESQASGQLFTHSPPGVPSPREMGRRAITARLPRRRGRGCEQRDWQLQDAGPGDGAALPTRPPPAMVAAPRLCVGRERSGQRAPVRLAFCRDSCAGWGRHLGQYRREATSPASSATQFIGGKG